MHTAFMIIGALVVVGALIGFFRSLWRPPGRRGNEGAIERLDTPPTREAATAVIRVAFTRWRSRLKANLAVPAAEPE